MTASLRTRTVPSVASTATTGPDRTAGLTEPGEHADALGQVDILIDVSGRADACVITVAGRIILEKLGRDEEPVLGEDVYLVKGSFQAISGPGRCPTIGMNDAVLLVRGVDPAVALAAGYEGGSVFRPSMSEFWVAVAGRRHTDKSLG
ncbi:hypothetical protein [Cryobacterium sp. GrIS_2_6]|uniref:hypothetical protein n=1 Tax=Cryobacterium sp. GrIS_2_6 TaxID=3162785 RepID=UPI002E0784F0|nr:hypothetical protein [Cryobacterium psychrotolerans]